MMNSPRLLTAAIAAILALGLGCTREEPLDRLWPTPTFELVDQQERPFGSADVGGRAAVWNFVYTSCTDTCPMLSATMSAVQQRLRDDGLLGSKVQLVSITVDPRRDTPQALAEYASRFRADPDGWRFLSGEPAQVYTVLAGFKVNTVVAARASEGADVVPHSNRFLVTDADGVVRAALPGEDVSPADIVRTVRRVIP